MILGNQIKMLRKSTKVNQKTFALLIGMSPVHYCAIENNKSTPPISVLEKIAKATGKRLIIAFIEKED
jgi:transcriptional regulator with XRE-family HTH domain